MGTSISVIKVSITKLLIHSISRRPCQSRMAQSFLFTTLFFCFLSLGSSKKIDKVPCYDTGCKPYFRDEAECVYVLKGNWSLINNDYKINTDYVPNLCRGSFDDCCRCFRRKIPISTTTTTTTTATTITTTTPPVGCIDVDGSCRTAFGGAGACIDVRTGNLTDIDPEVTPLADKCGTGECCQCFKMKTTECCKTLHSVREEFKTAVFQQIDTHNNRPVYKDKDSKRDDCLFYEKQWMVTTCEAFKKDKTGKSEKVQMVSKSNVDCPNQIDAGEWYHPIRPDWDDIRALSFSCRSKLRECCRYLRY